MSDKTCGTCAHGKHALVRCQIHGEEFPWLKKQRETCEDFAERTDSVKKIAREWYAWCSEFDLDAVYFTDRLEDIGYSIFE